MRDILTALAGLLVLVLVAALALPPFIPWEGQRAAVDRALSKAFGVAARTEGRIRVRLLPSPRLRVDGLGLNAGAEGPSLDARIVKAEIALAPLLKGDLHFTEARIGRAEIKVPVARGAGLVVPEWGGGGFARDLAVEDLRIGEFLVTRVSPATGRTDQAVFQDVHVTAPSLAGPWRVEGMAGRAPVRVATGSLDAEGVLPVKIEAGGGETPRLEVDARLALPQGGTSAAAATASGTVRLVVGPPSQAAGPAVPFVLQGKFATQGTQAKLEGVTLDVDQGGSALRLAGQGRADLARPALTLTLDARRLDLDAFLTGAVGQALIARRGTGLPPPLPIDLAVAVENATLIGESWSGLALDARFEPGGDVALRRLAATAPGSTEITASGDAGIGRAPSFSGHLALKAPAPARVARMLERVGVAGPFPLLDAGRPLFLDGDVSVAPPVVALRNARLGFGEARVTGNARYTGAAESPTGRARFDAQIAAQGLDVADLPPLRDLLGGLGGQDLGLTLAATDVRYGATGARGGRITANLQSDGPALRIDGLEVVNLAGADARVSGRIAADGTGRITGRVTAPRAAPLLDLAAAWSDMPRRLPPVLRAGALDLEVTGERAAGAGPAPSLVVTARGRAAGAAVQGNLTVVEGRAESFDLDATAPDASAWLGRPGDAALARAGRLRLTGTRRSAGMALEGQAEAAGLRLATTAPALVPTDGLPSTGTLSLAGADAAPLAGLLGEGVRVAGPLAADLRLVLGREGGAARATIEGSVAGSAVKGVLRVANEGLAGTLDLDRLALPALVESLALNPAPEARPSGPWSTARFGAVRRAFAAGPIVVRAARLDLGRGLVGRDATATLTLAADALTLSDLRASLAEGQVAGSLTLSRQEALASLSGEARLEGLSLAALASTPAGSLAARLSGTLRFGTAGESVAGWVTNLAGGGQIEVADLVGSGGDPEGLARAVEHALKEDNALRSGRIQDLVAEEMARGLLRGTGRASAPATLAGGILRLSPLTVPVEGGSWQGSATADLRLQRLDARGTLTARTLPKGWSGPAPSVLLGYAGPLSAPARSLDASPLVTGVAAIVLKRELDTIELYDQDQNERLRRQRQLDMDRARAAEAARQAADAARTGAADAGGATTQP